MTKLTSPISSLVARGSVGRTITFLKRATHNIVERKPEVKDAKSLAQLSWRHMYLKAVALWHALSSAEKQEWESLARPKHMTGFAWFISQALKPNPGLYLPLQGGTMSGDIDMAKHRLLKLPLPTDPQEAASKAYVDALPPPVSDVGEGHIVVLPWNYQSIGAGLWVFGLVESQWSDYPWENSTRADGDNISYNVYLEAETYTLCLLCYTSVSRGIVDIDINATEVASFDLYSAVPASNVIKTQPGIVIPSADLKTLKLRMHGKNPSASYYGITFSAVVLWRTT